MIEGSSCLDPELALVQNTKVYHDSLKNFQAFISETLESEEIFMFYSFNIFDQEDSDRPIKTGIKQKKIEKGRKF